MTKAFISYRRVDSAALATLIALSLKDKHGIDAFVDTRNTDGGGTFPDRLRRAIEQSDIFVCLLGETTLQSAWVLEEIEHAHNLRKTMTPIFQERYAPPSPIPNGHVEALLQHDGIHILDVRNIYMDQAIAELASMIRKSAPRISFGWVPLAVVGLLTVLVVVIALIIASSGSPGTPGQVAVEPTSAETMSPSPTLEPGFVPVVGNADWTIIERDFDGVPMVLVPIGCFEMGSDDGEIDQQPAHPLCFETPFWIDKLEVSNAQFARFDGQAERESQATDADRPRERVTWLEARDFCAERDGRLPSEAEWEYAARGPDNLLYPWGSEWNADYAVWLDNSDEQPADVGSIPEGVSWVGALDMIGNVWEWVNSIYAPYPYDFNDGREADSDGPEYYRVLRGGAWDIEALDLLTAAYRNSNTPDYENIYDGFRCALDV